MTVAELKRLINFGDGLVEEWFLVTKSTYARIMFASNTSIPVNSHLNIDFSDKDAVYNSLTEALNKMGRGAEEVIQYNGQYYIRRNFMSANNKANLVDCVNLADFNKPVVYTHEVEV